MLHKPHVRVVEFRVFLHHRKVNNCVKHVFITVFMKSSMTTLFLAGSQFFPTPVNHERHHVASERSTPYSGRWRC